MTTQLWLCQCDCGRECLAGANHLKNGARISCGCTRKGARKEKLTTHGHTIGRTPSRTFVSWSAMRTRCNNPNDPQYHNYGGSGVTVCQEWQLSFERFLDDMGERPEGKTLDRWPDRHGNYEPGNCRWATPKEQAQDRRSAPRDQNGRYYSDRSA